MNKTFKLVKIWNMYFRLKKQKERNTCYCPAQMSEHQEWKKLMMHRTQNLYDFRDDNINISLLV